MSQITTTQTTTQQVRQLQAEFEAAWRVLQTAEAAFTEEAAAVNAFRMHCRLRLDDLVDAVLAQYTLKQGWLARLRLLRADAAVWPVDEAHPLGQAETVEMQDEKLGDVVPYLLPQDKAAEKRLYRELVKKFHPDLVEGAMTKAYATTMMVAINNAYDVGDIQTLYDLAGELDPTEVQELSRIETKEVRRWREKLLKCQRRQRRVAQQLQALRQENITRLWRKAQSLDVEGETWWAEISRELADTLARLTADVGRLTTLVQTLDPTDATAPQEPDDETAAPHTP